MRRRTLAKQVADDKELEKQVQQLSEEQRAELDLKREVLFSIIIADVISSGSMVNGTPSE